MRMKNFLQRVSNISYLNVLIWCSAIAFTLKATKVYLNELSQIIIIISLLVIIIAGWKYSKISKEDRKGKENCFSLMLIYIGFIMCEVSNFLPFSYSVALKSSGITLAMVGIVIYVHSYLS